jgi:membrane-associated phospholipid phosphatase
MLVAILLGGLLGWIRMAQGGHYFSDIVVSCLIMWLSAAVLDTFFANRNEHVSHT